MLNLKKWWSMFTSAAPCPAGESLPVVTGEAGLQYFWLLPGDAACCHTPSGRQPRESLSRPQE